MQFKTLDRPNHDVIQDLYDDNTPLSKVPFPDVQNEDMTFQEFLATTRFEQVVEKLRMNISGEAPVQEDMENITKSAMDAFIGVLSSEDGNYRELEALALRLVKNEFGITDDMIDFDVEITGFSNEITIDDFNVGNPPLMNIEIKQDLNYNDLDLWRMKRRLANAIIQGSSVRGHYMYALVEDEIKTITNNPNIVTDYGVLMSNNDLSYWQIGNELMPMLITSVGSKVNISRPEGEDEKGKIVIKAFCFPFLVHEIIKGVMEILSIDGMPKDPDLFDKVSELEDTLESEIWDIRLGPPIWDILRSNFPDEVLFGDDKTLQMFLLKEIFNLEPKEFLKFFKEILSNSDMAKELIQDMVNGIKRTLKDENYNIAMDEFQNKLNKLK